MTERMTAYAEKLAPAHLPLAQSLITSGGWNSLACFAAFTPTPVGARDGFLPSYDKALKCLERIWPQHTRPWPNP
jgi:hypothetical protein